MSKTKKLLLIKIYISIVVPLLITYLFSVLNEKILILMNERFYPTNQCNWILTILAIILVLSTYIMIDKKMSNSLFYLIGIFIGIISRLYLLKGEQIYQTSINLAIIILGYAVLIIVLIIHSILRTKNRV